LENENAVLYNVDAKDPATGTTALWWASYGKLQYVAHRLLDLHLDESLPSVTIELDVQQNGSGTTPLFWAAHHNISRGGLAMRLLNTNAVDPNLYDHENCSGTLNWACANGCAEVAMKVNQTSIDSFETFSPVSPLIL
tara:strand:- start:403 stop:816 length:414 start_codon:yes stop_codon:yes gene_type:complete